MESIGRMDLRSGDRVRLYSASEPDSRVPLWDVIGFTFRVAPMTRAVIIGNGLEAFPDGLEYYAVRLTGGPQRGREGLIAPFAVQPDDVAERAAGSVPPGWKIIQPD